jgi:cephalosporin hydroxylase
MKIEFDLDARDIVIDGRRVALYSDAGFAIVRDLWLKVGWNQKYAYTYSWLGVPIIQLPDDMIRYQEAVFALKPDVIVETGIAHGGSLVYSASLCRLIGKGRVIGVDIEIRPHNRTRLEAHPLIPSITLIEGSSIAPAIVAEVKSRISADETVLVVLDSNHSYAHVTAELDAYAPLVTPGSYIVATDGIMRGRQSGPRGRGFRGAQSGLCDRRAGVAVQRVDPRRQCHPLAERVAQACALTTCVLGTGRAT